MLRFTLQQLILVPWSLKSQQLIHRSNLGRELTENPKVKFTKFNKTKKSFVKSGENDVRSCISPSYLNLSLSKLWNLRSPNRDSPPSSCSNLHRSVSFIFCSVSKKLFVRSGNFKDPPTENQKNSNSVKVIKKNKFSAKCSVDTNFSQVLFS